MSHSGFLARSQVIEHPSGVRLHTPLLVPSFSSKGFPPSRDGKPWISRVLEMTSEWITDKMLISAYDVHHGHIPKPTDLPFTPELTIIDSGGYEAGYDEDLSAVAVKRHDPEPWAPGDQRAILDLWPERLAAVFVSYDHPRRRLPLAQQVLEAKELFKKYPKQMHSLLLKPETETQFYLEIVLEAVSADPAILKGFHVIGVTEKELGSSFLQRMQRIAELRADLDSVGISTPIQVFGALDPITSCLYFVAGAEIFDGLTWLRYAYRGGLCVYRANYGALEVGLDRRDALIDGKAMVDNLGSLSRLEQSMRRVALYQDFRHFSDHRDLLRKAFDDLRVRLEKGRD